jgi:putative sugar O-methyltransferase
MTFSFSYPELEVAREDMKTQSSLYQPSLFWSDASAVIVEELCQHGVENFRRLRKPMGFFAPTYGVPGNSLTAEQVGQIESEFQGRYPAAKKQSLTLRHHLSGEAQALADYRVLLAADEVNQLPHLDTFSESNYGDPVEHFEFGGRRFSRSALNYLLGLAFLKKHLKGQDVPRVVMEIGGGFGTLGEVMAASGIENFRYVDLDIPPTSFVAQSYLCGVFGSDQVSTYADTRDLEVIEIEALRPLSTLCAWQIEKLRGKVDLFVNSISFQEMEPLIVRNYLHHDDRLGAKYVLLRNLREGKPIKTDQIAHGVEIPILGGDYDVFLKRYDLMATNVHPFGYRTVDGFHSELRLYKRQ